jgi:hypothetical protein
MLEVRCYHLTIPRQRSTQMAACGACNTTILFGGVRDGNERYCNSDCHGRAYLAAVAQRIPRDVLREHTASVYRGMCPRCQGPGPVDVHTSYRVWSALFVTSWRSVPRISCARCGRKAQIGDAAFSLVLGWWGFPWGFIVTPLQIARNVGAMIRTNPMTVPSADLERMVGILLASQLLEKEAVTEPT